MVKTSPRVHTEYQGKYSRALYGRAKVRDRRGSRIDMSIEVHCPECDGRAKAGLFIFKCKCCGLEFDHK